MPKMPVCQKRAPDLITDTCDRWELYLRPLKKQPLSHLFWALKKKNTFECMINSLSIM